MMRAGTYYVGDLCYVMHPQWKEVCNLMFNTGRGNDGVLDGEFNLANGVRFAVHSTAYGDGTYYDAEGRKYPVDAGLIGCIAVEDVYDPEWFIEGVNTVVFNKPFQMRRVDDTIVFVDEDGKTIIDIPTGFEDEEETA